MILPSSDGAAEDEEQMGYEQLATLRKEQVYPRYAWNVIEKKCSFYFKPTMPGQLQAFQYY